MEQLYRYQFVQTFQNITIDIHKQIAADVQTSISGEERAAIVKDIRELYFLDADYIHTIEKCTKVKREIQFADGTHFFIYLDEDENKDKDRSGEMNASEGLIRDMKQYYLILRDYLNSGIFSRINPHMQVKPITLHYYPLNIAKQFPTRGEKIFTPRHVNTGCTFIETGTIYLWRQEEILKVMIHELMHAWKFDYGLIQIQDAGIHKKIRKNTIVKDSINVNETYNELWAEIIQLLFYSMEQGRTQAKIKKTLRQMIERQNTYNLYQIGRICDWTGIRDWKNIFIRGEREKSDRGSRDRIESRDASIRKFPQNTNVFSYYCLKGVIWNKLGQFLDNLEVWSKNGGTVDISSRIANYFYNQLEESVRNGDLFYQRFKKMRQWKNSVLRNRNRKHRINNFRMMYL